MFTILAILVLGYFFIMITNVDIVILAFSKISSSFAKKSSDVGAEAVVC